MLNSWLLKSLFRRLCEFLHKILLNKLIFFDEGVTPFAVSTKSSTVKRCLLSSTAWIIWMVTFYSIYPQFLFSLQKLVTKVKNWPILWRIWSQSSISILLQIFDFFVMKPTSEFRSWRGQFDSPCFGTTSYELWNWILSNLYVLLTNFWNAIRCINLF